MMKIKSSSNLLLIICILYMLLITTKSHDVERHRQEMSNRVVPLYVRAYQLLRNDIFDPLVNATNKDQFKKPMAIFLLFNRTICASIQMTEILQQARKNSLDIVNEVEASQFEIVRTVAEKADEIRRYEGDIHVTQTAIAGLQPQIDHARTAADVERKRDDKCKQLEELEANLAKYKADLNTHENTKKSLEALVKAYYEEKERARQQYNEVQKQQNFTAIISTYTKQVAHHLRSLHTPSSTLYSAGMMLFTFDPWLPSLNAIYEELLRNQVMKELGFELINQTMIDELKDNLEKLNRTIDGLPEAVVAEKQCRSGEFNDTLEPDPEDENLEKTSKEDEAAEENTIVHPDLTTEEMEASTMASNIENETTTTIANTMNDLTTLSEINSTLNSATSESTVSSNDTESSPDPLRNSTAIYSVNVLDMIRNNPSGMYHLATNLDLFNSSFHSIPEFNDVFNGLGFTISNFTYIDDGQEDNTTAAGLFQVLRNGRIENVQMQNCIVHSNRSHVGCLVGHAIDSTIERVGVTSGEVVCTGDILSNYAWTCGGLVGRFSHTGLVNECFSNVNVNGDHVFITGGIVGGQKSSPNQSDELRIINSYSTGDVSGRWSVGGLSGGVTNKALSKIIIKTSFSFGKITAIGRSNEYSIGGLVGSDSCAQTDTFFNRKKNSFRKSQCGKGLREKDFITLKTFHNYDTKIWNLTMTAYPSLKFEQVIPEPLPTTTATQSPTTMSATLSISNPPEGQNSTLNQTSI